MDQVVIRFRKEIVKEILNKMSLDYECVRVTNWRECKDIIDNINDINN